MKSALAAVSVVSTALLLTACEPETKPHHPTPPEIGQTGENAEASPTPSAEATPEPGATPGDVSSTPIPAPTPMAPVSSIPYGTPVPGKPGYVISPWSNTGYVDVQGIPPNTEVKDPYSGKTFLVP